MISVKRSVRAVTPPNLLKQIWDDVSLSQFAMFLVYFLKLFVDHGRIKPQHAKKLNEETFH